MSVFGGISIFTAKWTVACPYDSVWIGVGAEEGDEGSVVEVLLGITKFHQL